MKNTKSSNNLSQNTYNNPLIERYSSKEMLAIFSPQYKFSTWRKLWLYLAEAQQKVGLAVTHEQLKEMKNNLDNIDFEYAKEKEKEFRHDVMAHIHTFAKECPQAAGIIHLGATSAYVGDNTDLIQYREAFKILQKKTLDVIYLLKKFSLAFKEMPTLAYTHFQTAQPTTVGKRASLWLQDVFLDYQELQQQIKNLPFRGVKGTTGSQASLMKLLDNNSNKVKVVEEHVCKRAGFKNLLPLTGQTYTRKLDFQITSLLSKLAQSAAKFANDLRLLSHLKEVEEPFEKNQIGSSAMPYKRNPIRSERINSLARFVVTLANSTAHTASTQWLERTLDDSANKRLTLPECFLAVDAILEIYRNILSGLKVNEEVIKKNFQQELPFIIMENVLMDKVQEGGNRQVLHEVIRKNALKASEVVKKGGKNPLLSLMSKEKAIKLSAAEWKKREDPNLYIGRSAEMVEEFIKKSINPLLKKYKPFKEAVIKV